MTNNPTSLYIDFTSGRLTHRRKQASLRKELLARAMGASPKDNPFIVDATAGLGRDSFILAALGFQVTMIERSDAVYSLLEDGLARGRQEADIAPIIERLVLIHADANLWLRDQPLKPDIIYLDPMFPERKKSASAKKEMVILQELLGKDDNVQDLFHTALGCAKKRVVVKRPRLAANIAEREPNFSLKGKSSRFDIYLT